ncbi:MAG: hypothetical protein LBH31_05450 [Burkholderiaceae bacterium]|nr:hypothetical protein [Burkholderiaceae bacterium]
MRKIKIILISFIVSWAAASHVQAQPPQAKQPENVYFSVASDRLFGSQRDQRKVLRRLVQRNGQRGRNDLCVVGGLEKYMYPDDSSQSERKKRVAWVIWKQDHSIILWEPSVDSSTDDLAGLSRYLHVPEDAVADPQKIPNHYLVSSDWVREVRLACNRVGEHFVIIKPAASHVQGRPPQAKQVENVYFSVASDPLFGNQREVLRRLVQKNGQRGRNDLCVVGVREKYPNGTLEPWKNRDAFVVWKQDHSIIDWNWSLDIYSNDLTLTTKGYTSVPGDVVVDPGSSTFLETPDWVSEVRQACNRLGQHFIIMKR